MAKLAFKNGAIVTIVGRRMSRLETVCSKLLQENNSGKCFTVKADMSLKEDVIKAVDAAVQYMDGLDALVLNHAWGTQETFSHLQAGVIKYFEDLSIDEIEEAFDLTYGSNVLGNMWLIHKSLPFLKANTSGRGSHVLYVSSLSHTYVLSWQS